MHKPNASITHSVFNVEPVYTWDFTQDSQKDFVFYSASSVIRSMLDSRIVPRFKKSPSRQALRFKQQALIALREELATCGDEISDQLLLAVLYMGMFERLYGNFGAEFQTHTSVLQRLTRAHGGLESVGSRIQTVLSNYDFFTSIAVGQQLLESTSMRRVPLLPTPAMLRRWQPLLSVLPTGFQTLTIDCEVSTSVIEVLIRINTQQLRRHGYTLPEYNKHLMIFESTRQRYSTWWEACPSIRLADIDGKPAFERILCLGLLLFACYFFSPDRSGSITMAGARAELSRLFAGALWVYRDAARDECLSWVWAVTIASHATPGGLSPDGVALGQRFHDHFPDLCYTAKAQETLSKFFYENALMRALEMV